MAVSRLRGSHRFQPQCKRIPDDQFDRSVFCSVGKGASEYSAKLLEFMQANTTATFDFAQELLGVKSLPQAGELWTGYSKKQFEALTAQAKELAELSKKIASETAEPIKASASKIFTTAA